jgi:hypothetical protein
MRFQKTVKKCTLGLNGAQQGLTLKLTPHLLLIRVQPVLFFSKRLQPITANAMCTVSIMLLSLTHLILSISCGYLIKFHDFANNNQEGMKHQMRGATQAQLGMTLWISLLHKNIFILFSVLNANL